MKSDIEIADSVELDDIVSIASRAGIDSSFVECYGPHKAKVSLSFLEENKDKEDGNLILVTAINPTPLGEGKTTTSIGLADGLNKIGKKAALALREPSMGPVFGVKGGATGGGMAQVAPMADINLHFNGDFHAVSSATNLLCALLDNHIFQGNDLNIDPNTITLRRVVDMNDRTLRHIITGLGAKKGSVREDGFDITVASEVMAILCLSSSMKELKERLSNIFIGYSKSGECIRAKDLKAQGAMAAILKDAMKPNLVQTLEGTPAFIHGGPFANIAHGCNSILATKMALKCADYAVTEAGFGGDLGAEKFFDIKCRRAGLKPKAVVLVATVRALKLHGGGNIKNLGEKDVDMVEKGCSNLRRHIRNMKDTFGMNVVVALNHFVTDDDDEIRVVGECCRKEGVDMVLSKAWAEGGEGTKELAEKVVELCSRGSSLTYPYEEDDSLEDKVKKVVAKVYGGSKVTFAPGTRTKLRNAESLGFRNAPICMAKTQYSFSDDPKKLGAPEGFTLTVRDVKLNQGAGFVVVLTGEIMTMPGLPKVPQAEFIDVTDDGRIVGLM
ncbi:MAG: formate--tetrahydrofolate ligase [Candidatus Ornithospirochaeta sp.]